MGKNHGMAVQRRHGRDGQGGLEAGVLRAEDSRSDPVRAPSPVFPESGLCLLFARARGRARARERERQPDTAPCPCRMARGYRWQLRRADGEGEDSRGRRGSCTRAAGQEGHGGGQERSASEGAEGEEHAQISSGGRAKTDGLPPAA